MDPKAMNPELGISIEFPNMTLYLVRLVVFLNKNSEP